MDAIDEAASHRPLANVDLEIAILGCVLSNSKTLDSIDIPIKPEHFYDPCHGKLFSMAREAHERGAIADTNIMAMQLSTEPWFVGLGGKDYLEGLKRNKGHPRAINGAALEVHNLYLRRALVEAADDVCFAANDVVAPIEDVLNQAEISISEVTKGSDISSNWADGHDLVEAAHRVIGPDYKSDLIPTGLATLDNLIGGIRPGKMTVFAARASMGKSTVAIALMEGMARQGYGVAMFSLEMDRQEVIVKMGCLRAYDHYRNDSENPSPYFADRGELYDGQKESFASAVEEVRRWNIAVDDRSGLKPSQIKAATRSLIRKWKKDGITPGSIIVDHLHVVRSEIDRGGNRVLELGDISEALTDLAKETGVAVVAFAQLNRGLEERSNRDKRPQLSDLRGSGKIEEDAYAAIFIYRPEYYLKEPEDKTDLDAMNEYRETLDKVRGKLFFLVEKNRGGARGECEVRCSMKHSWVG